MEVAKLAKQDVITRDELRSLKSVQDDLECRQQVKIVINEIKQTVARCAAQGRTTYVHNHSQLMSRFGRATKYNNFPIKVNDPFASQRAILDKYKQCIGEVVDSLRSIFVGCSVEYVEVKNLHGQIIDSGIKVSWD